ncbi:MAG TPA: phosphatase PAP2 family protein [Chthoniobacterales bacterium]|nr:phosphatase PAP2 family protein [Chthoniobacterales bacterium]
MKQRFVLYWTLGILIAVIAIMAAFYFDASVVAFMAGHQTSMMRNFMLNVSQFGDWPEHFLVGLALLGFALWRGNKKWARIFLAMLIAFSIAGLTGRAIKVTTGRARPSVKAEHGWNGPRVTGSKYHSFPSGHVDASVGFFVVLLLANRRVGFPCLAIPILIGFSRMYLSAHYLSDVVCAAVLGIGSAVVVVKLIQPRLEKRESTHPKWSDA